MQISVRQITQDDWQECRKIRLQALAGDPEVFGSNYAKESVFTEQDWKQRIGDGASSAIFFLYDGEKLIGTTGIYFIEGDKKTAIFGGTWLAPEYRGKGLSEIIYETRISWVKEKPDIEKIVVSHRESNLASKYANQKHGFRFTHETERTWSDGKTEKEIFYELKISD